MAAKCQTKVLEEKVLTLKIVRDVAKPANLKTGVVEAINKLANRYFYQYRPRWLSQELAEGIWNADCVSLAHNHLIGIMRKQLLNGFVWWDTEQPRDSGASLNRNWWQKYAYGAIIPSESTIRKIANQVTEFI